MKFNAWSKCDDSGLGGRGTAREIGSASIAKAEIQGDLYINIWIAATTGLQFLRAFNQLFVVYYTKKL